MGRSTKRVNMTLRTIILTFVLNFIHIKAINPLCAAVCECQNSEDDKSFEMDCSRVFLSIVPPMEDWASNVTHMDLSVNNITALDFELSHSSVEVLDLSNNHISSVVQYAFGGLSSLKYLNLGNNNIKNFDENGFYGLDHLKSLNLSDNDLHFLPEKLFYNFIGLQELSLAGNPLVHMDPIHLNRMISLRWLDLSDTELYSLQPNIFHTTGQLEFLDLSTNEFHEVPTDALRSASKLKILRFSENPVDVLHKKSFVKLRTLEVLELNDMAHLKEVKEETFSTLEKLRVLEMRYNRQLHSIDRRAFDGLFNESRPALLELDLEGNQLQKIDKDLVPCAKMRKFNIQKNPWVCDCTMKWIKDCEIQKIYSADLKCQEPETVANALIVDMEEKDFSCDYLMQTMAEKESHHGHVIRSISLGLAAGLLVILALGIVFVIRWRSIRDWYKESRKGTGAVYYVRARSNPRVI